MERTIKECDFPVGRGANIRPHGEPVEQSTKFKIDSEEFEVDLCDDHRAVLRESLQKFIEIARRTSSSVPRNARGRAMMRAKGGQMFTTKDVRIWLKENGHTDVPASGRIPNRDIAAYKTAHGIS